METYTCEHDGCSCIIVQSNQNIMQTTIPFIPTKQGGRVFGSGSISIHDLFGIADIPSLDFGMRYEEFCEYTSARINDLNTIGTFPTLWQRNGDKSRIRKGARWIGQGGGNSMPDGILIGESTLNCTRLRRHSTIGNWDILELEITNTLQSNCPSCGPYQDDNENPIFQNRCANHECQHHNESTSPFQIIDGQHRSLILKESILENKEVSVSILLADIRGTEITDLTGYDVNSQAKIFTQVNTESKDLDQLHKTWLKRFFGKWSTRTGRLSEGAQAFDILAETGKVWPRTRNDFQPFVKMHPRKSLSHRIDSARGADMPSIGGKASLESIVKALDSAKALSPTQSKSAILVQWLNASCNKFPTMLQYNNNGVGLFDNTRPFESYLRNVDKILEHIINYSPTFANVFDQAQFEWSLDFHNQEFINSTPWNVFLKSGESPWKELYVILRKMWTNPLPNGVLMTAPNWTTQQMPNGNPCTSWNEYITLHPDPIDTFSVVTYCDQNSSVTPNGNLSVNNQRASVDPGDDLEWERPVNCVSIPNIDYQYRDTNNQWTQWYNDSGKMKNHDLTSENRGVKLVLTLGQLRNHISHGNNNVQWNLRITYTNVIGNSTATLGFISS